MSIIPSFFGGRRSDLLYDPTSFDIWDPWHAADPWELFSPSRDQTSPLANVRIDWKETPEAHIIQADLPGMKKEEVKLEVDEGRVLQISGEKSQERKEKTDKWHKVERSWGKFLRRFRLPENAKVDEVKATMENGVLTVVVPKEEVKQPATKAIEISGGEKAEQQSRGGETAEQQSRRNLWFREYDGVALAVNLLCMVSLLMQFLSVSCVHVKSLRLAPLGIYDKML